MRNYRNARAPLADRLPQKRREHSALFKHAKREHDLDRNGADIESADELALDPPIAAAAAMIRQRWSVLERASRCVWATAPAFVFPSIEM